MLVDCDTIIRIGCSQNVSARITSGYFPYVGNKYTKKRKFIYPLVGTLTIHVKLEEYGEHELAEAALIARFKPKFNKVGLKD